MLEECRDKKGKLDEKKALLKLIDTFTISQSTPPKSSWATTWKQWQRPVMPRAAALRGKAEAAR